MRGPRWRLILNGKSTGNADVRDAVHALRGHGVTLEVRVTWEDGDAERYVAEAIEHGVDTIIAAGGDGTLSEVAETLAHRDEPADALPTLGLLPLGTANDFATAAGIPAEPLRALQMILRQPARPIDLLRIDADGALWWCANVASGGFGTEVTVETDEGLKKCWAAWPIWSPAYRGWAGSTRSRRGCAPRISTGKAASSPWASATGARRAAGRCCAPMRGSTTACSTSPSFRN